MKPNIAHWTFDQSSRADNFITKRYADLLDSQRPGVASGWGFPAGDVGPGDHRRVGGADFVILGESPVDVLGRSAQGLGGGVLTEKDFAHPVARVQVPLQGCNHAKLGRHFAKICRLAGRLCCGNKAIGVDLKLKRAA